MSGAEAIGRQAKADDVWFRTAYKLGHHSGWWVGYRYAYNEQEQADRIRQARMHDIATTPRYLDLERIRWDGKREDFGKPRPGDYMGGPVDWETSRPLGRVPRDSQ